MEEVERFFRQLVDVLSERDPDRLRSPIQISEIYQSILPYRHHRAALGFDTNEDYEMALLRLLAGEGGFATIDPAEVQAALVDETHAPNPYPGAFREYAAARVYLNQGAVRTVTEAHDAYAPPDETDEPDEDDLPPDVPAPPTPSSEGSSPSPALDDDTFAPPPVVSEPAPVLKTPPPEPLPSLVPPEPVPASTAPVPVIPIASARCVACGEDLPTGRTVNFCPHCGQDQRAIECPECGTSLEARWRFCITCGFRNQLAGS